MLELCSSYLVADLSTTLSNLLLHFVTVFSGLSLKLSSFVVRRFEQSRMKGTSKGIYTCPQLVCDFVYERKAFDVKVVAHFLNSSCLL